jgi:hypothetical protein
VAGTPEVQRDGLPALLPKTELVMVGRLVVELRIVASASKTLKFFDGQEIEFCLNRRDLDRQTIRSRELDGSLLAEISRTWSRTNAAIIA